MIKKATNLAVLIICGATLTSSAIGYQNNYRGISDTFSDYTFQDSLPALHTIQEKDIATVATSFENHTITVTLKNGKSYTYLHPDWDMEEYSPSLCKKLKEAIRKVKITFTKVEQPPAFPGGEEGWQKYMSEFCQQHKKEIEMSGLAEITLRFIVHLKGEITDVTIEVNPGRDNLGAIARKAILDGPHWIPAVQNGHTVTCYTNQVVKLNL